MAKVRNCYKCDSKFGLFKWRNHCEECGRTYCSDCIVKFKKYTWYAFSAPSNRYKNDYLCKNCWNKRIKTFDKKYIDACRKYETVESFPKTYKGKIPINKNIPPVTIKSDYFRNRDDSLSQLKITALMHGYNVIYKVEWIKETESESGSGNGTYYYSVWKAVCTVGKLK